MKINNYTIKRGTQANEKVFKVYISDIYISTYYTIDHAIRRCYVINATKKLNRYNMAEIKEMIKGITNKAIVHNFDRQSLIDWYLSLLDYKTFMTLAV